MKLRARLVLLTAVSFSSQILANWQCDVKESFGNKKPKDINLILSIKDKEARLKSTRFQYTLNPISAYKNNYDYVEQLTTNIADERISSKIIFRFNSQNGILIYINHNNSQQMIIGKCLVAPPEKKMSKTSLNPIRQFHLYEVDQTWMLQSNYHQKILEDQWIIYG
ncbi:MAG: hypothetical protein ACI9FB_000551 [Candidatus Azotimanducaceae bacterium]